jgi:amicoumacin kinase
MSQNARGLEPDIKEFCPLFGLSLGSVRKLEAFENFVYEVHRQGTPRILRISHRSHRTVEAVRAEFHWVDFLRGQGMAVAGSLFSVTQDKVCSSADQEFVAVLIEKMPGRQMSLLSSEQWNADHFFEWGRTIGQMHRLTKLYRPGVWKRMSWDSDRYVQNFLQHIHQQDPIYRRHWLNLLEQLNTLSRTPENYGLIHDDLHTRNFCLYQDTLQVFDTDDCKYNFFMGDIATALHSVALNDWSRNNSIDSFLKPFWRGYARECPISIADVLHLPLLMRACSAVVFGALCHKWDLANLQTREQFIFDQVAGSLRLQEPIVDLSEEEWIETLPR